MTAPAPEAIGRRIGGSIALLATARISTVAALFGVNILSARIMTPDAVGAAAVGQTIGMVAALLANGGLNISTIYLLRQRPQDRARLVPALSGMAATSITLAALLGAGASVTVGSMLSIRDDWQLAGAAAALGASIIAFEYAGALLLGVDRRSLFVGAELVRGWGSLIAVAALLVLWPTAGSLVAGLAVGYFAGAILALGRVRRDVPTAPSFDRAISREALRFGMRGQMGNIFQFLGARLDLLLVPAFLGLASAGIYFVAVRISDVIGQVATAAASFLFPQVAAQGDRLSTEATERVVRRVMLIVLGSALFVGLAARQLLAVFGSVYTSGAAALLVLLIGSVPLALGRLVAADLKGRGRPGLVSLAAVLSVATTVVFGIWLIPGGGIVGAATATLASSTVTTIGLLLAYRSAANGRLTDLIPRVADLRAVGARAQVALRSATAKRR